jgi:hypothetical protein
MDAQVMLVGYFLYCGTLLLLIVASSYFVVSIWAKSSGLIKCRSFRPSAGICFLMYAGAAGICGGFLCQWVVERKTGSAGRYDHL